MKFTSYARIMKNIFDRTLSIASPIQTNQRYTDNQIVISSEINCVSDYFGPILDNKNIVVPDGNA